jgi:hypothetical protein
VPHLAGDEERRCRRALAHWPDGPYLERLLLELWTALPDASAVPMASEVTPCNTGGNTGLCEQGGSRMVFKVYQLFKHRVAGFRSGLTESIMPNRPFRSGETAAGRPSPSS